VPSLNIVAYGTSDSGDSVNTDVWVFHTLTKQWFRWPDVKCQSMMVRTENDSHRLYFGTDNGRLLKTQAGVSFDFGTTGKAIDDAITGSVVTQATKSPIALGLKTGSVYPAGNAQTETAFRNLVLYLRARGTYSVTANVTIDNYAPQTVTFSSSNTSALLGTTFTLGTSILGARAVLAPLKASLDGYGYGATVEITHASADQDLEIFGYGLEYETAENRQETLTASTAA
jgi:hypothetical protein